MDNWRPGDRYGTRYTFLRDGYDRFRALGAEEAVSKIAVYLAALQDAQLEHGSRRMSAKYFTKEVADHDADVLRQRWSEGFKYTVQPSDRPGMYVIAVRYADDTFIHYHN
jgi:hypothetical protein